MAIPKLDVPESMVFLKAYLHMGVTLFFVLSAFSLCVSTTPRLHQPDWLWAFGIRRFLRISPLFYFMTLFYLFVVPTIVGGNFPFDRLFQTVTFIFGIMPGDPSLVWAGWTIGAEMVFYVTLPFVLVFVQTGIGSMIFYLLSLAASIAFVRYFDGQNLPDTYSKLSFFGSFGIFAVGIVAYHAFRQQCVLRNPVVWGRAGAGAALGLGAILVWNDRAFFYGAEPWLRGSGLSKELSWAPVFGLIVLSQALNPLRVISNRLFNHLGDLSFSIYLCHPPIVYFMQPIYRSIYSVAPDQWSALAASAAITFAVVYAVSLITFTVIERPGIACGERIIRRRATRPDLPRSPEAGNTLR